MQRPWFASQLSQWQDKFYEHMAARFPELERGQPATVTQREHLSPQLYKQATALDKQMEQVRAVMEAMRVTNVGKKKEELNELLDKWMRGSGNLLQLVDSCQDTLKGFAKENARLSADLRAAEQEREETHSNLFYLKKELEQLKKRYSRIPSEIRREFEQAKRNGPRRERG